MVFHLPQAGRIYRAFSFIAFTTLSFSLAAEEGPWWRHPFGMFQTNMREIDAADMNVTAVLNFLEDYGVDAWLINVGGILANYPTSLSFQTRNPYLSSRPENGFSSENLIQEAINETHGRGMRLLARMDFSKVQADTAREHPDWLYRSPEGLTQNHTAGLVSVCPSGRYYQERIFDILDEVTGMFDLDGFFVNWASFNEEDYFKVYHGVCHCSSCKRRWVEDVGNSLELPDGPNHANYNRWLAFSSAIIDEWTANVRSFVGDRLPDAGLILGDSADIMFHEANNEIGRALWAHQTTETVSSLKSYRPSVPVLVNAVSFVDMPYRMGSEEPAHFAQYLVQCISRGGNPSTYIMGNPGKIPYTVFDVGSRITRFHKKWRHVYDGMEPLATIALVLPDEGAMSEAAYEDSLSEFRGLYTALQELHVPFDIVGESDLVAMAAAAQGGLRRYKTIVLPSLGNLTTEGNAAALDSWAQNGGHIITTGLIGTNSDGASVQLDSLPVASQKKVIVSNRKMWSSYMAPADQEQATNQDENFYTGPVVPIFGSRLDVEWKSNSAMGGEKGYKMLAVAPFSPPEYAYGNVQAGEPGWAAVGYGEGKGITIPFTVGRGYHELGMRSFRDFFELVLDVEGAKAGRLLKFDGLAEQVEVTISRNADLVVVHLINLSGLRGQNFRTELPIPRSSITALGVQGRPITAKALVGNRVLEVEGSVIKLPEMDDLFEVVAIQGLVM